MLCATNEERGTVAGLASLSQDLDDEYVDGASCLSLILGHWYDPLVRDRNRAIRSQSATPEQSHAIRHLSTPCGDDKSLLPLDSRAPPFGESIQPPKYAA